MTAITCCGRSWFNDCQICEEKAYADYITEMNNNLESKYVDPGDMEDYEEKK